MLQLTSIWNNVDQNIPKQNTILQTKLEYFKPKYNRSIQNNPNQNIIFQFTNKSKQNSHCRCQ